VADSPNRDVLAFFSLDRLEVIGQEIDARQTANHRGIGTNSGSSGCSALIGYGGRCTARIVSEETKKLLQQLLQGRPVKLVGTDSVLAVAARHIASSADASISHLVLRKQSEVPEIADRN
jgi:hypothetical protein